MLGNLLQGNLVPVLHARAQRCTRSRNFAGNHMAMGQCGSVTEIPKLQKNKKIQNKFLGFLILLPNVHYTFSGKYSYSRFKKQLNINYGNHVFQMLLKCCNLSKFSSFKNSKLQNLKDHNYRNVKYPKREVSKTSKLQNWNSGISQILVHAVFTTSFTCQSGRNEGSLKSTRRVEHVPKMI